MSNRIVARFLDGRLLKGSSFDIDPARPMFHVRTETGEVVQVRLDELKALFFVKTFEGNAAHNEDLTPDPGDPRGRGSTVVKLRFHDGETMVGLTNRYPPPRPFFYVVPVDQFSNNHRVLVNGPALQEMERLDAAP